MYSSPLFPHGVNNAKTPIHTKKGMLGYDLSSTSHDVPNLQWKWSSHICLIKLVDNLRSCLGAHPLTMHAHTQIKIQTSQFLTNILTINS